MQYLPLNRKKRAAMHRRAAREAEVYGLMQLAQVDWEMAEVLDPAPRKQRDNRKRRN